MMKALIITALFALIFVPSAMAINTIDSQKKVTLMLEIGREHTFNLQLKNITARTIMTVSGNASEWLSFGPDYASTLEITNLVDQALRINIFVPTTASIKNYEAVIKGNNDTISVVYVQVTDNFVESVGDLENQVSSLKSQINNLKEQQDVMESRINEVKAAQRETVEKTDVVEDIVKDVRSTLNEVKSFQEDLRVWKNEYDESKLAMESEVVQLQNRTDYLQQQNDELTGLTGALSFQGTSLGLLLVIVIGGFAFYAYSNSSSRSGYARPKIRLRMHSDSKESKEEKKPTTKSNSIFDSSRFKVEIKQREEPEKVSGFPQSDSLRNFKYQFKQR